MRFFSAWLLAFSALGRHRLRTLLTMLGITIGIASVICTIALGEGGSSLIQKQLLALGDNFVWIEASSRNVGGVRTGAAGGRSLLIGDMEAIVQNVPFIKACTPQVDSRVQAIYGNKNWGTTYRGVTPDYLNIRRWSMALGGIFSEEDITNKANVCVLGRTVAENLFADENPLDQTIRLRNLPFTVIGVLNSKGQSAMGSDEDDVMLIPYTTAQRKMKGIFWLDDIMCSAVSAGAIEPAREQITGLLRDRHRLTPDADDDFTIRKPEDALNARAEANRALALMIASIGSIALLVGGIGVMNIMLVSVVERTREIGLRMAVGATEMDVQLQFIAEAVILSLIGGGLGVMVGTLASRGFSATLGWPMVISSRAVIMSELSSAVIGVFFGYYPARKASRLDPIEALRFE